MLEWTRRDAWTGVRGRVGRVAESGINQDVKRRSAAFGREAIAWAHLLELAVQRYLDGYSIRAAAQDVGIGATTVFDELVRRGHRRRSANKRAKYGVSKEE